MGLSRGCFLWTMSPHWIHPIEHSVTLSCNQQISSEVLLTIADLFWSLRSLNLSPFTHHQLKDNLINPQIALQTLIGQNCQKHYPTFQYSLGLGKIWKSANWNGKCMFVSAWITEKSSDLCIVLQFDGSQNSQYFLKNHTTILCVNTHLFPRLSLVC